MTTEAVETKIGWWEKSVEYAFIAKMVERKSFLWAVPMDGNEETAYGDLIANWNGVLLLIEFKRDNTQEALQSEHKKYANKDQKNVKLAEEAFNKACTELFCKPGAKNHGLIYGEAKEGNLVLKAALYWTPLYEPVDAVDWCMQKIDKSNKVGDQNEFDTYLELLSKARLGKQKDMTESSDDGSGSSSSGGSGGYSASTSFVVGIGEKGKIFAVELETYKKIRLDKNKELDIENNEEMNKTKTPKNHM